MGAGASKAAGQAQSNASMMSALIQAQQAQAAQAAQERMYRESVERMEPFRQGGVAATNRMQELYGIGGSPTAAGYGSYAQPFSMADYQADPGYAFRVQEGQRALESSAAARGGLLSGGTGKALTRYGQEAGSQEYGNAYARFMANRAAATQGLQNLMGTGAGAAGTATGLAGQIGSNLMAQRFGLGSNLGTMAGNAGSTVAGAYTGAVPTIANLASANPYGQAVENMGQARASSYMGGASALQGALQGVGQNAMLYGMMDRYGQNAGPTGTYQFGGQTVPYFGRPA